MKSPDPYTIAFNALKKRGEQARPFQVLIRTEYNFHVEIIQHWEDLVTGEKRTDSFKKKIVGGSSTSCDPFLRDKKGPYFLNPIENVVAKFRKRD